MTTDPIADLLTRIRNAGLRRIEHISVPHSRMKESIIKILKDENFIIDYTIGEEVTKNGSKFKTLEIDLRYAGNKLVMENLKKVSTPGIRTYIGYSEIPKIRGGIGICILSTPKGVMLGKKAKELKVGGELICTIY